MTPQWLFTESEIRQWALLEWLSAQGEDFPSVAAFYENDDGHGDLARNDVKFLNSQGLVDDASGLGGLGSVCARLTPHGRLELERLNQTRSIRPKRQEALRSAVLLWLSDEEASSYSGKRMPMENFFSSPFSWYYGQQFDVDELLRATDFLANNGMIRGNRVDQAIGPINASLTEEGLSCVEQYDASVSSFLSRSGRAPGGGVTFNVSGTNVQVAAGDHSQQVMNVAYSAADLVPVVEGIAQLVRLSGLSNDETALALLVREAVEGLTASEPSPTKTRRFLGWVKDRANGAIDQALGAALVAAAVGAEQMITTAMGS